MPAQLPTSCPSCGSELQVKTLACPGCDTSVRGVYALPALVRLSSDDQEFVKSFVLDSGSLKDIASRYGVSYPTVRNRLDDLIARLLEIDEAPASENNKTGD